MNHPRYKLIISSVVAGLLLMFYFYNTIPSNSFSIDQYQMLDYSEQIFDGRFRYVGMRTSRLNWNFPIIHYILLPLAAIKNTPYSLYLFTAVLYTAGLALICYTVIKYRSINEYYVVLLFGVSHVWSLFYASFSWPPNHIPFFMSLFIYFFIKYLTQSNYTIYFHFASIALNVVLQLHSLSIVIIFGFIMALIVLGKLPPYKHWLIQAIIQLTMLSPWLIYHTILIDWTKEPTYHPTLFRFIFGPVVALFDYISGYGLTKENTLYLTYGTNSFPFENLFSGILKFSGMILFFLIIWSIILNFSILKSRLVSIKIAWNLIQPYRNEEKNFEHSYPIALLCLIVPVTAIVISGMAMHAHYFQYLTPLIFILVSTLLYNLHSKLYKSIAWVGIIVVVISHGIFSYWRAWEERKAPYLDDIGYTHVLAEVVAERCTDDPQIRFFTTQGVKAAGPIFYYRYDSELEKLDRSGKLICREMIVFQNKLIKQSDLINWHLKQLNPMIKLESNNNKIWIMGKRR